MVVPSSPAALGSEQRRPRDPPPPPGSGDEGACHSLNLALRLAELPIPTSLCRHSHDPVEICPEMLGAESGGSGSNWDGLPDAAAQCAVHSARVLAVVHWVNGGRNFA